MRELVIAIICCAPLVAAFVSAEPVNPEGAAPSCLGRGITDPASARLNAWGENATRGGMLDKGRRLAEAGGIKRRLGLEIGLAGAYSIYNSVWLVEPLQNQSFYAWKRLREASFPSPETDHRSTGYALLWRRMEDLRVGDTPSDPAVVPLGRALHCDLLPRRTRMCPH